MAWDSAAKRRGRPPAKKKGPHAVGVRTEEPGDEFFLHRLSVQEIIDNDPDAWGQDEQNAERQGRELDEHTAAIAAQEAKRRR